MNPVGKPDAGKPHVRFDERGRETWPCWPTRPSSTLLRSFRAKQQGTLPIAASRSDVAISSSGCSNETSAMQEYRWRRERTSEPLARGPVAKAVGRRNEVMNNAG